MNSSLLSSFGRMFPDCSLTDAAKACSRSSLSWSESGILARGQVLMLSGLASHSADAAFSVCSLAEILEPNVAAKYFLSSRAARGILRRAAKRGKKLPEVDEINFAPRVKVPTLMLNGRYDHFFPLETSQNVMFRFLGTPDKDKRHAVLDGGHIPPYQGIMKEVLDWLDKYQGPVK